MSTIDTIASNPGMTKENTRKLTAEELDAVTGGMLHCAKGAHFPEVVMENAGRERAAG